MLKKCEVYPFVKPNMPIEFCSLVLKGLHRTKVERGNLGLTMKIPNETRRHPEGLAANFVFFFHLGKQMLELVYRRR